MAGVSFRVCCEIGEALLQARLVRLRLSQAEAIYAEVKYILETPVGGVGEIITCHSYAVA